MANTTTIIIPNIILIDGYVVTYVAANSDFEAKIPVVSGGSGPGAIIFTGATNPENLKANRASLNSVTDATKLGIVNLGSRSTGASVGAATNYITISGGDQNTGSATATNTYSTIGGGLSNTASGQYSTIIGGSTCIANNIYTSAGGYNNTASGQYASSIGGYFNGATGNYSSTFGGIGNITSGIYSIASGYNPKSSQDGQYSFSSSSFLGSSFSRNSQFNQFTYNCTSTNAISANFVGFTGQELLLTSGSSFAIRVTVTTCTVGGVNAAVFVRDLLVQNTLGGVLTIVDDNYTLTSNAPGYGGITISAPSGSTLRIAFVGKSGLTARAIATINITEMCHY